MTISRKRTGSLEWDDELGLWVGNDPGPYQKIRARYAHYAGDAFMGGIIIGVCGNGVLWCVVMALATRT